MTRTRGPVVAAFHHPPWGSEFASAWARARLATALEGADVWCLLAGHSHQSSTQRWGGMRVVVGGAAQGKDAGFTTLELRYPKLVVRYHPNGGAERMLVDEPLAGPRKPLGAVRARVADGALVVTLEAAAVSTRCFVELTGGGKRIPLGDDGTARVKLAALDGSLGAASGPRGVVVAEGEHGRLATSVVEVPGARRVFRTEVGSGVRTRPVVIQGALLVGTEGGELVALDPKTGSPRWFFPTRGPILGAPVEWRGAIVFGSGDGKLRALSARAELLWELDLGAPLYATPALSGDELAVTDLDGTLHVLDGVREERLRLADGPVEAPALVASSTLVQGAWDRKVHAVDLSTLTKRWEAETDGPRAQKAKKYYSPADAPLALTDGALAACDRDAKLTLLDLATGERRGGQDDAWAVASCEGGFVVKGAAELRRIDKVGGVLWKAAARLGRAPAAPLVHRGLVWTCSDDGEAQAFALATGERVLRERVNPGELVLAAPGAAGDLVYFGSLDGSVVAFDSVQE